MNTINEPEAENAKQGSSKNVPGRPPQQTTQLDTECSYDARSSNDINKAHTQCNIQVENDTNGSLTPSNVKIPDGCRSHELVVPPATAGEGPNRADEMLDVWKQWQNENWHSPGFSDEFLFTF